MGFAQLSSEVRGGNDYQTTATIGPGHNASETTWVSAGAILTWSYTTTGDFEFSVLGPMGVLDHQYPGTEGSTYGNGTLVKIPGNYTFAWKSHELSSSVIVDYTVNGFQPSAATLVSPQTGITNSILNLTASGTMDIRAARVAYSLDNITYSSVTPSAVAGSWSADLNLSRGNNSLYIATTYSQGHFSHTKYQTFSIQTGFGLNFIPSLQMTSPASVISTLDLDQTIYGPCDANATSVYVSLDNITFTHATKDSSNWRANVTLSFGSDTIYMRADYQRGEFSYQYNDKTSISVDKLAPNQGDGSAQYDLGIILLMIAIIAIIVLVLGFVLMRKGKMGAP